MIRAIKITIAAISLASCAPQLVRMDYAEYLEKQSTLRKFTEPTKKSKLYVANTEESRGGALIAYSSIEMNLSIVYPKSFHAFCLPPGDYSFVYKIGFMESTPLAIHLEAGKIYSATVSGRGTIFSPEVRIAKIDNNEMKNIINLQNLGPPADMNYLGKIPREQFPCTKDD